jgi:hypothetical protein
LCFLSWNDYLLYYDFLVMLVSLLSFLVFYV